MPSFMLKAALRLVSILVAVTIIRWGIVIISNQYDDLLQALYTVGIFILAIIIALLINWVANRITFNGSKKGK